MTLLDRYLAKRFIGMIFRILLAMSLLVIIIDLLTARQESIIKYAVPLNIVVQYYLCFLPTVLFQYQTTALAVLVAGLMVLGRAAQDREIVAAMAGGISLRRITRAPILVALVVAVGAFMLEDTVGVKATAGMARIDREYFSQFSKSKREGVSWTRLGDGWTCHILSFNRDALTGRDVYIHKITDDKVEEIRARRIFWDDDRQQWLLEDGRWFTFNPKEQWEQNVERITQLAAPFHETPDELFALEESSNTKSAYALWRDLRHAEDLGQPVSRYWVDFHAKFARPALCFVMIFLAIPFAVRLRRGGMAMGFGVSVGIGLAYLMVFYVMMGLGRQLELIPPAFAAWFASVLFFIIGLRLFQKTPT
jgi:lipopolysaccharide export system permease protein